MHVPWAQLLRYRQTWAFAVGKFMTDPIWWLYLFWIPDFLNRNYGIDLRTIGPPLVVIYLIADVGSIGGGWLSSFAHQARLDHQRRAQDGDARLRARGHADRVRLDGEPSLGGGRARRSCGGGPSGLVGQSLHAGVGHVPAPGGRIRGGIRWNGRRGRRHAHRQADRLYPGDDRQLRRVFLIAASAYLAALAVIHLLLPKLEPAPI